MARPSAPQTMLGMALILVSATGYLSPGLTDWLRTRWATPQTQAMAPLTYRRYQDKQVSVELPSGWRWLAQKPDGAEAGAAYFAMSRFQGQNALQGSVSLRVDGIPNVQHLSADALLDVIAKGIDVQGGKLQRLDGLPKGLVGIAYPSQQGKTTATNFVFVSPAGPLSYVLSLGSDDDRFTRAMALRVAQSLTVTL